MNILNKFRGGLSWINDAGGNDIFADHSLGENIKLLMAKFQM